MTHIRTFQALVVACGFLLGTLVPAGAQIQPVYNPPPPVYSAPDPFALPPAPPIQPVGQTPYIPPPYPSSPNITCMNVGGRHYDLQLSRPQSAC
jgi:hypothetical protein